MTSAELRKQIEGIFTDDAKAILRTLDGMDPRVRINLLRDLTRYETERVRERIEELTAILPLEDRP